MRFDLALKKSFGWILAALLAVAAYFQASGITQLVGASIALAGPPAPPPLLRRAPARLAAAEGLDHTTVATAILERNPFDSVTGALVGDAVPQGEAPPTVIRDAGPCESAKVILISASDDPSWSFASIAAEGGPTMLRRVGDEVGSFSVEAIERDRVRLTSKQIRCEAVLGATVTMKAARPPVSDAPKKPGGVPPEIAAGIRQTGERAFTVQRSALDAILARQAELFGRMRIAPDKEGLRIAGIRPDSLLGTLGIQNGDHLQRINGFDIANPQSALEAYSKLMSADHLVITATRGGQPLNYDMKIE